VSSVEETYQRACPLAELGDGEATRVELDGVHLALAADQADRHAVSDVCSHAEISLSEGEVDGLTIECWLHGSRFDLVTGHPTGLPATKPIPVYPVKIEGDDVYVSLAPLEES